MTIDRIWEGHEGDIAFEMGYLFRRYPGSITPNIFVGLKAPERLRCIAVKISKSIKVDLSRQQLLKDIRIELNSDDRDPALNRLLITLANQQHRDIFSALCEDLISNVAQISDEKILVRELINRFEKWKALFEKAGLQGLTLEEQRGLYGELFFIRKWFSTTDNLGRCIKAWVGPGQSVRDFQIEDWALEVKTTHGNNHQRVSVSSERQLDTSTLSNVYLFHLSMDVQQSTGETLVDIIEAVKADLQNDLPALSDFNFKLLEAGYYNQHQNLYTDKGYHIRQENVYHVSGNFPRIEESELRDGVGDVKYSIILSTCKDYLMSENHVFEVLNQTSNG
jgi:hypothetical protein